MKLILDSLIDLAGPAVALIGIIATYPILKKKLTANHISWRLDKIQSSNFKLYLLVQSLKDRFMTEIYTHDKISKEDLEKINDEIKEAYYLALEGSSDVATLLNYLKFTLETSIRTFDRGDDKMLFSNNIYMLIINVLELVSYYSNQVVQVPKSSQITKSKFVVKPLTKFVTNSDTHRYKHFKTGVIYDPNSAHYTMFIEKVNRTHHPYLMRCAYQLFQDPKPIGNLLYLKKIYAPLIIEYPQQAHIFGPENQTLHLIGFIIWKKQSNNSNDLEHKEECELIYSNLDNSFQFINAHLDDNPNLKGFNDIYLQNDEWKFSKAKVDSRANETIKFRMEKKLLEENFERNRKEFKRKLKK